LRLFQRSMHNRLPEGATSREITLREGAVIAPLVICLVAIALYPALILDRGEASVERVVGAVAVADCGGETAAAEGSALDCAEQYGLEDEGPIASTDAEPEFTIERAPGSGGGPSAKECARLREFLENNSSASLTQDYEELCLP
jgi:hypothetical protein